MAKKVFNGHTDAEKYSKEEAIEIVKSKVDNYIGNKTVVASLHLFDMGNSWTCTTNKHKEFVEAEEGAKEVQKFDIPEKAEK